MKKGSRIFVTGAGGELGRFLCAQARAAGFEVIAGVRSNAHRVALEGCQVVKLDVTKPRDIAALAEMAAHIDGVVNCAAIPVAGVVEQMDPLRLRAAFDVNVLGPLRVTQAVLPVFRARRSGLIAVVSSTAGRLAGPFEGGYSATKWALEAVFETLHHEVVGTGIRVLIAEPGSFQSGFDAKAQLPAPEDSYYAELRRAWEQAATFLRPEGTPTAAAVAKEIVAAIGEDEGPLRIPIGADAKRLLPRRQSSDDESFFQYVESTTGFPMGRKL